MQHTKGPLELKGEVKEWWAVVNNQPVLKREYVAKIAATGRVTMCDILSYTADTPYAMPADETQANAERLVARWNAADGLDLDEAIRRLEGK